MASYDRRDDGPEVHGRMGFDEREAMMAFLLRTPAVFSEARQVLVVEHFTEPYEVIWALCWQSCIDLYDQFGRLPPRVMLEADVLARIENHPDQIAANAGEEVRGFLASTFDLAADVMDGPGSQLWAFDLLKKFLKERHWTDPARKLLADLGEAVPADVPALMADLQTRYSQVQSVTVSASEDLIPVNWAPAPFVKVSTGMPFLDEPMGGGGADGEVYGLLGGYGSGKTMLACGIGAEAAIRFRAEAEVLNRAPRFTYHATYEAPPDDIRRRVISYFSGVHLTRLEAVPYHLTLSRTGRREAYEELMFPTDPRGEWERYQDVLPYSGLYKIGNFRGDPENPKAGDGWIGEIRADVERVASRTGVGPGVILIDYALVCTRRHLRAKGLDPDRHLRHFVGSFGDECRKQLAAHFNCQVWVLNQLSGQANKRAPTAKMNHADSAEATNFAENLWYCFCMGNKDRSTNLVVIDCTKTRRSQGVPDPTILQLRGEYARFFPADDRYMIDPNTRRLVPRSVGEVVAPVGRQARLRIPDGIL